MSELKNPGTLVGSVVDFDAPPDPREFLREGGIPGVDYLYVLSKNVPKAQRSGWEQINGVPHFMVQGHGMTILGRGKPSLRGRPGASKCRFYMDKEADQLIADEEKPVLKGKKPSGGATPTQGGATPTEQKVVSPRAS